VKFVKADVTAADTGPMDRLRRFGAGWTVLTASIALLIVYFAIGGLTGEIVWDVAVFGQLAIATAAACRFSCHRGAWLMIIAGQACFLAGDIGFTVLEYGLERELFPSVADALYLAGYPLMAIGLIRSAAASSSSSTSRSSG
jgi:hypothetical protein